MNIDLDKTRRETVRWLILLTLNQARPVGAGEGLILSTLQAVHEQMTQHELRRELQYLEGRDLVRVDRSAPQWRAELTRHGVDVAEYTVPVEAGIARPQKYW